MDPQSPQTPASAARFSTDFGEIWKTHPVAMVATTTVLIALGAVALYFVLQFATSSTGDEPPIRVRGGSFHLGLATTDTTAAWNQDSNTKSWNSQNGTRKTNQLHLVVLPKGAPSTSGSACDVESKLNAKEVVVVTFADSDTSTDFPVVFTIQKKGADYKTIIDAGNLQLSPRSTNSRWIENMTKGYISKVVIAKPNQNDETKPGNVISSCTFTDADDVELLFMEN